jgi:hypothetical protein
MKKEIKYWYLTTVSECVLCGAFRKERERVKDKLKPGDWNERNVFKQFACEIHFI